MIVPRPVPGKIDYVHVGKKRVARLLDEDGKVVFEQFFYQPNVTLAD